MIKWAAFFLGISAFLGWLLLNALRHGTVQDKYGFKIARVETPVLFLGHCDFVCGAAHCVLLWRGLRCAPSSRAGFQLTDYW